MWRSGRPNLYRRGANTLPRALTTNSAYNNNNNNNSCRTANKQCRFYYWFSFAPTAVLSGALRLLPPLPFAIFNSFDSVFCRPFRLLRNARSVRYKLCNLASGCGSRAIRKIYIVLQFASRSQSSSAGGDVARRLRSGIIFDLWPMIYCV